MQSKHSNLNKNHDSSNSSGYEYSDYENIDPSIPSSSKQIKKSKRSSRRTDAQFDLLKSIIPLSSLNYVDLNLAWDNLSKNLNAIGPPRHSTSSWRKIWSCHKAKAKKRMTSSEYQKKFGEVEVLASVDRDNSNESLDAIPTNVEQLELPVVTSDEDSQGTLSKMSKKVDALMNQQTTIMEQQSALIEQQKVLIETVQKMSNRLGLLER